MGQVVLSALFFYTKKDVKKNKRTFLYIILAISLVDANMIVLNGFMDGYTNDFLERTMESSSGHLNIYPNSGDQYIEGLELKKLKLEGTNGIFAYSPRLSASGSLSYKEKSKPVKILGLDPVNENNVTILLNKIESGETIRSYDRYGVLVSYRLADELNVKPGDDVTLVFEKGHLRTYRVKGIIRTGLEMDKNTVIMNFEEVSEQLDITNRASMILVKLIDETMTERYKEMLSRELLISKIKKWREEVESVVSSMDAYRQIIYVINVIGLFVAGVTLGIILYINILHAKRQIGIMKAIGMKDSQVLSVYLFEALLLGVIGILIGSVLGYLGIKLLEMYPFYDPVMGFVSPHFYFYLITDSSVVIILTTLLASMYPVLLASRTDIIKAIWGE